MIKSEDAEESEKISSSCSGSVWKCPWRILIFKFKSVGQGQAAKNNMKSESETEQRTLQIVDFVCCNSVEPGAKNLLWEGRSTHTADIFLISHPPVPSSLFKLASAWGKIYCVTCLTNYRREVASWDHLLKQPFLFAQQPLKRSTPCTTVHLHYMR